MKQPREYSRPVLKEGFIYTTTGYIVGALTRGYDGWRFISRNSAHKGSRKARLTALEAIPRWTRVLLRDGLTQDNPETTETPMIRTLDDFK